MAISRYHDRASLSIDAQILNMNTAIGEFRKVRRKHDEVIWEGYLQPTPMSKTYRVRIEYKLNTSPKITLPDEVLPENTPHTFGNERLCLYHRKGFGAWRPDIPISRHLIPMISHWLWCFELWRITGQWHGEEFPHNINDPKEAN